jgi:predicted nucleotidyltransferase
MGAQMIQLGLVAIDERKLADLCRRYGVRELSVFGSAARGEMRPDSDIDLLVEFLPDAEIGLLEHAGLMLDLAELLGRKVDLVSKRALKPLIRESILQEARPVGGADDRFLSSAGLAGHGKRWPAPRPAPSDAHSVSPSPAAQLRAAVN